MSKYTKVTVYHKTWGLKLVDKTFDINRVIDKLKRCAVDFTNLKDNGSAFSFDTTTPDKVDFHLWYSKHNSKKFGHKYHYFGGMDFLPLPF